MKKFIKILAPILMFSLFASYSFAEKYAVENPDRFANEKHQELDCNLSIRDWSICDAYGYKSMFCYGKDGEILSENERKKYDNDNKNPKETGYVTIYLNNDIIFNKIKTYFPKRGTPRIKYGIYRPGNLEGNNTSQIIYSKINVNSKK